MKKLSLAPLVLLMTLLGGCATLAPGNHISSSLVNFLYPKGQPEPLAAQVTTLRLPIRVGIAFVPAMTAHDSERYWTPPRNTLSIADQTRLLQQVARYFHRYRYIKTVEVIPGNYLMPGGGFNDLDAIASMYGVDVIALVSYDQVQNTGEGWTSLAYLTIIGAFAIPAEHNTTTTFVDTAVFDVATHALLFRAPGTSRVHESSTPIAQGSALRQDQRKGFDVAFRKMIANLDASLATFKKKVKNNSETYQLAYAPGYSGGGAAGWWLGFVALPVLWLRRRGADCRSSIDV